MALETPSEMTKFRTEMHTLRTETHEKRGNRMKTNGSYAIVFAEKQLVPNPRPLPLNLLN